MCTALIAFQVLDEWPLFIATNRDEDRGRPFTPPQRQTRSSRQVLAPRDERAGGTWIGASSLPLIALITNRTDVPQPDPEERTRSRGLLVDDVLGCNDIDHALEVVEHAVDLMRTSFNLMIGNHEALYVVENTPSGLRLDALTPGVHVLSSGGRIDDDSVGEVAHARELWFDLATPGHDPWQVGTRLLSCDEARGALPPICKRSEPRGTVCGSLIGLHHDSSTRLDFCPAIPGDQPFDRYVLEAHG